MTGEGTVTGEDTGTGGIVDLGDPDGTHAAPTVHDAPDRAAPHCRTVLLASGAAALLILAANLAPHPDAPPSLAEPDTPPSPAEAIQPQERAPSVCEAVAVANRGGESPSRPTVLPGRADGYYAPAEPENLTAVVTGLTYPDGTVSLCRPVREPGTGSPEPGQRELPLLARGETYAYDSGPEGLVLIGERAPDGRVMRYDD